MCGIANQSCCLSLLLLLQIQQLLQQLTALPNKTVMRDMCTALLAEPVAEDIASQLTAALQQLHLEGKGLGVHEFQRFSVAGLFCSIYKISMEGEDDSGLTGSWGCDA